VSSLESIVLSPKSCGSAEILLCPGFWPAVSPAERGCPPDPMFNAHCVCATPLFVKEGDKEGVYNPQSSVVSLESLVFILPP